MRRAGTPFRLDEPAEVLVMDGPFRFSRNPGYLSFAMIQGGISCLTNSLWAALLLPATVAIIRRRVVEREERYLEREFGEQYLRYKARVRRWL
jgi:protein-S-isoprenylcysteine O-methyltransferase Ste14